MDYKKKILISLVESYRCSKKDISNSNKKTKLIPNKIFKNYGNSKSSYSEMEFFNKVAEELELLKFIKIKYEDYSAKIKIIYLIDEKIDEIENYLFKHYNYKSKDDKLKIMKNIYDKYSNSTNICKKMCIELNENIKNRKIVLNLDKLDDIFKAIEFIELNKKELFIRQASSEIYKDKEHPSKYLQENTLHDVCRLLIKYSNINLKEYEKEDEILKYYNIIKEHQPLRIKGNLTITYKNGNEINLNNINQGIEFSSLELVDIEKIEIFAKNFITVENQTSFLEENEKDNVYFFLGGYKNRYQRDFIKMIYLDNPNLNYLHFGDLDAGGLYIHRNLCESTGISFGFYKMSTKELENDNYKDNFDKLTKLDRIKLENLKKDKRYKNLALYMLENNIKLEQEILI